MVFFEIFKRIFHALAALGYLPKLRRVMGLVFSSDFLHTFSIKTFLFKYPIKLSSLYIWGMWPQGLKAHSKVWDNF